MGVQGDSPEDVVGGVGARAVVVCIWTEEAKVCSVISRTADMSPCVASRLGKRRCVDEGVGGMVGVVVAGTAGTLPGVTSGLGECCGVNEGFEDIAEGVWDGPAPEPRERRSSS